MRDIEHNMKVLFLSTQYGVDRSGTAYSHRLEKLRHVLRQRGIQTPFLSLRDQPVGRPILAQPLNLPLMGKKMADFDFIHAGGDAAYVAALWKPFTRARVIHDVHGDTLSEAQLKWTVRPSPRRACWLLQAMIVNAVAYRHADYFLVVSKPLKQRLVDERHLSAHRIGLIRNGVDLELFHPPPHNPTDGFIVCYAGGFQSWQAIDNLVSAFELLPKDHVRLKIIGFTEHHADLKSTIAGRLGERVELVDRVSQRELVSQLAAGHALIIPRFGHRSVEVALPTKFSEYLALGRPIIVCDVDETASLVRQHRCGLVSEPSPAALAETIRAVSHLTEAELSHMGRNARGLAEREFSWDEIGRKYADLLIKWGAS